MQIINTLDDYKGKISIGLAPDDRYPNDYLRMVARVFAAYREHPIDKAVVAYLDGFVVEHLTEIVQDELRFLVHRGTAFVDDQFIATKDSFTISIDRVRLDNDTSYSIVLQYQYLDITPPILPSIEIVRTIDIHPEHQLELSTFKMNPQMNIDMDPQHLNTKFLENFGTLFTSIEKNILEKSDVMNYSKILVHADTIASETKSGDFVYYDAIDSLYKPAKACTYEHEKTVGLYLKIKDSGTRMIVTQGIIEFKEGFFELESNNQLLNLEIGESYYLTESCTDSDLISPGKPGSITKTFFASTVRIGSAINHRTLMITIDYTTELGTQNILEILGTTKDFREELKYGFSVKENSSQINDLINIRNSLSVEISSLNTSRTDAIDSLNIQIPISSTKDSDYNSLIVQDTITRQSVSNKIKNSLDANFELSNNKYILESSELSLTSIGDSILTAWNNVKQADISLTQEINALSTSTDLNLLKIKLANNKDIINDIQTIIGNSTQGIFILNTKDNLIIDINTRDTAGIIRTTNYIIGYVNSINTKMSLFPETISGIYEEGGAQIISGALSSINFNRLTQKIDEVNSSILILVQLLENLINELNPIKIQLNSLSADAGLISKINDLNILKERLEVTKDSSLLKNDLKKLQEQEAIKLKYLTEYVKIYEEAITDTNSIKLDIVDKINALEVIKNNLPDLPNIIDSKSAIGMMALTDYQRRQYNYTWLTTRIQLRYRLMKSIQENIDKIDTILTGEIAIDFETTKQLTQLKISHEMQLESSINSTEVMIKEYNEIRTTYYGLPPIIIYEEFDEGGYSNPNLECL